MFKLTILIVENNEIIINTILKSTKDNYNIEIVKNNEEIIKVYKRIKPDLLIISDINILGLKALEIVKEIRKSDKKIKIVVLTTKSDLNSMLNAIELNLIKYILNPIKESDIKKALEIAMQELIEYKEVFQNVIKISDECIWDVERKVLIQKNVIVKLTPKESKILDYMMSNINIIHRYDDLIVNCWDFEDITTKDSLKNIMSKLRKKLPEGLINNIYGEGFRIRI